MTQTLQTEIDQAIWNRDSQQLRALLAKEGCVPQFSRCVRICWACYWKGDWRSDESVRLLHPYFPECGDSPFHPLLTLEDGINAENPRLVNHILYTKPLEERQLLEALDYIEGLVFQRRGCGKIGDALLATLLERYPFLEQEGRVSTIQSRTTDRRAEDEQLSSISRAALATMIKRENDYAL